MRWIKLEGTCECGNAVDVVVTQGQIDGMIDSHIKNGLVKRAARTVKDYLLKRLDEGEGSVCCGKCGRGFAVAARWVER